MVFIDEPCDVSEEVNAIVFAEPVTRAIAMPVELSFIDDGSQRNRVQQAAEFTGPAIARINRHADLLRPVGESTMPHTSPNRTLCVTMRACFEERDLTQLTVN